MTPIEKTWIFVIIFVTLGVVISSCVWVANLAEDHKLRKRRERDRADELNEKTAPWTVEVRSTSSAGPEKDQPGLAVWCVRQVASGRSGYMRTIEEMRVTTVVMTDDDACDVELDAALDRAERRMERLNLRLASIRLMAGMQA